MKSKLQKRLEAEERQAIYNSLTKQQKLQLINKRRGNSTKEAKKIEGSN